MRQKKNDYGFYKEGDLMEHHTPKEKAPVGKGFNDMWLYTPFYFLAVALPLYAFNRPIIAGYIQSYNIEIKAISICISAYVLLYTSVLPGIYKANKILIADFCTSGKAVNYILNIIIFVIIMACLLLNLYGVLDEYPIQKLDMFNKLLMVMCILYPCIKVLNIVRLNLDSVDETCKKGLKTVETVLLILLIIMMVFTIVYRFYPPSTESI